MNMTQAIENENFTTTFLVDQTPREVFHAVTNVRGWWSENIQGSTAQQGDEFVYHFRDIHSCEITLQKASEKAPSIHGGDESPFLLRGLGWGTYPGSRQIR